MILFITMSDILDLAWLPVVSNILAQLNFLSIQGPQWQRLATTSRLRYELSNRIEDLWMNLILLFQNSKAPSKTVQLDVSILTSPRPSKLAWKVPPFAQGTQRKSSQMPLGPSGYFRVIPRVLVPTDTLTI